MPSLPSQALRYAFGVMFGSWVRFLLPIGGFALGATVYSRLGGERVTDKILFFVSGLIGTGVLFGIIFLVRWAILWCQDYDQRVAGLCKFKHVHEIAAQDEAMLCKSQFVVLDAATFVENKDVRLIRFSFRVHNGSVFTLSLAEEAGKPIGHSPILDGIGPGAEPIQLGQPIFDVQPCDPAKHGDYLTVAIKVPAPESVEEMLRLRDAIVNCPRVGGAIFQFRGYITVRVKVKETKRELHIFLPSIHVAEANRRGLRASMVPDLDPRYF